MVLGPAPVPYWDIFVALLVYLSSYISLHIRRWNKYIVSLIEIFNCFKLIPHAFQSKLISSYSLTNRRLKFQTFAQLPNTFNQLLFAMTL